MVLYDQLAGRWVISQFASASGGAPITDECVAVSTTGDATGTYNCYAFHLEGIIVVGNEAQKTIIRAIGPSLGAAGVSGALPDPTLELHDSNGALLATNDNWRDAQEAEITSSLLAPANDAESAIVATLPASPAGTAYTAIVRGLSGTSGVALVEFYSLSPRNRLHRPRRRRKNRASEKRPPAPCLTTTRSSEGMT